MGRHTLLYNKCNQYKPKLLHFEDKCVVMRLELFKVEVALSKTP